MSDIPLRDYFAVRLLAALIGRAEPDDESVDYSALIEWAYELADEMLEVRQDAELRARR